MIFLMVGRLIFGEFAHASVHLSVPEDSPVQLATALAPTQCDTHGIGDSALEHA